MDKLIEDDLSMGNGKKDNVKIVKTFILHLLFFLLGASSAIIGPTLLDLGTLTNTSIQAIVYIFTARAVGNFTGSTVKAFLVEKFDNWLLMGLDAVLLSLFTLVLPFTRSFIGAFIILGLQGVMNGALGTGGNVLVVRIWEEGHKPWIQSLQCMHGVGSLVAPIIASPFLSPSNHFTSALTDHYLSHNGSQDDIVHTGITSSNSYIPSSTTNNDTVSLKMNSFESQVWVSYVILSGIEILFAASCFVIFVMSKMPTKYYSLEPSTDKKVFAEGTSQRYLKIQVLVMGFAFMLSYSILEVNFGNFATTYIVKYIGARKIVGAHITTAYWTFFTIGRGLGILLIHHMKPGLLLTLDCILAVFSLWPLLFFAKVHIAIPWISACLLGLGVATVFATLFSWLELLLQAPGAISSMLISAAGSGDVLGPLLFSVLFPKFGMQSFVYAMFSAACLMSLCWALLFIFVSKKAKANGTDPPSYGTFAPKLKSIQKKSELESETESETESRD